MSPGRSRISIRTAREEDRAALLGLAPRLAIGIAPWRGVAGMEVAARGWIAAALDGIGPDQAVFVAEDADGVIHGFAGVARQVAFTGEPQAYLGELAVAEASEGAGVGRMLVEAVEAWARARGLGLIVLDTGAGNHRARQFYARNGFVDEGVKLTKVLRQDN
ncbi:MAG: GNAT family N-acetyltransferase [Chloroflexota bacterium]|nr:GNAT family N-acetyltransferase [Chloroflexota bacterium]